VLAKAQTLRNALADRGIEVLGRVSPIVLAQVGPEALARLAQRECFERGLILNSIEFPACRRGMARFRLQVTPRHDNEALESAARIVADAITAARTQLLTTCA
jgi:7-keto-8-aminopelargonate synthetase-like enzyme